jgi:hypothetical protein
MQIQGLGNAPRTMQKYLSALTGAQRGVFAVLLAGARLELSVAQGGALQGLLSGATCMTILISIVEYQHSSLLHLLPCGYFTVRSFIPPDLDSRLTLPLILHNNICRIIPEFPYPQN